MALEAVRARPGLNNLELSEIIGLSHHSQTSRMMRRLQKQGLVENSQSHTNRHVKSWRLTIAGQAVLDAHGRSRALRKAHRKARRHRKLATNRTRKSGFSKAGPDFLPADKPASAGLPGENSEIPRQFRMTTLTHEVLTAVANLSVGDYSPNNRDIALAAGARDEGHISKVLRRLEQHGLLQNTGPVNAGAPKAWHLTPRGEELLSASSEI
jgi:DNA-binding MarR family transcriptional regulator